MKMTIRTTREREKVDRWLEKNPLRTWRYSHRPRVRQSELAASAGTYTVRIQQYEWAVQWPQPEQMAGLARACGITPAEMDLHFRQWVSACPVALRMPRSFARPEPTTPEERKKKEVADAIGLAKSRRARIADAVAARKRTRRSVHR